MLGVRIYGTKRKITDRWGHEDKGEDIGENLTIHKKRRTRSDFEILGTLISRIPRARHRIVIIASASSIQKEMEDLYVDSYKREGFTKVVIIKVQNKKDAEKLESIKKIKGAHAVFFTGGDQQKLISRIRGTELLNAIRRNIMQIKILLLGGTSAGAMVVPEIIITGGIIGEALYKEDIKIKKDLIYSAR